MKLIEADKVEQAIKDYWRAQVDKLPKPGNVRDHDDFVDRLNSYIEHNHDLLKAIDELPSAEPDTTTHDSIPAETGENDGDRTSGDCISRQRAIDALKSRKTAEQSSAGIMRNAVVDFCIGIVKKLPSAQPVAKKIGYAECANAMLKMWIDNVLTDGEYNRIMDKLNAHYDAERRQK